ncbi:MAG: hypothetical protein ABI882_15915 [Acidobacteriota bacterium]
MRQTIVIVLFALAATTLAPAQDSRPKSERQTAPRVTLDALTVDQILDKYVQSLGGRAAIEKVTTRSAKGSFELPTMGVKGEFEYHRKAPNRAVTIITLAGYGASIEGYDGKVAWASDPAAGVREKSGVELSTSRLDAEFNKELRLRQLFPKLDLKGAEKVGGRDAWVILATPIEGPPEKWYFDVQTGLLVRSDIEREGPQGKMPFELYLEDYREVDGMKVPFSTRLSNPSLSVVFKADEIKQNNPLDEAKFRKPTAP